MVAVVLAFGARAEVAAANCPSFRLELTDAGAYEVRYEDLARAGLEGTLRSSKLALLDHGRPVPLWLDDRGDGNFGPGDRFEFVGERLAGETSWNHPASLSHPYFLRCDPANALRMPNMVARSAGAEAPTAAWLRRQHLERDRSLVRFAVVEAAPPEADLWFWTKISSLDEAPFEVPLDLSGLDASSDQPVRIRLRLRGWSKPRVPVRGFADHRVQIGLPGRMAMTVDWTDEGAGRVVDLPPISARQIVSPAVLSMRVSRRPEPGTDRVFADVVLLDWVEVSYPHSGAVTGPQRLELSGAGAVSLAAAADPRLVFLAGSRVTVGARGGRFLLGPPATGGTHAPVPPVAPVQVDVLRRRDLRQPQSIELDAPSDLRAATHRADYLIISHARFLPAIARLAEHRRRNGLAVETVDVQDVYDEWSHGVADPRAIRDFMAYAVAQWSAPAPRFLLLVGDASWDARNDPEDAGPAPDTAYDPGQGTLFTQVATVPYHGPAGGKLRNLIPTWSYETLDGHAAGDNFFVDFDADVAPELAVGRLPVVDPAEVDAIVDKIVRYETAAPPGAWRNEIAFLTTEDPGWQGWSNELAARAVDRGLSVRRVYAPPLEPDGQQGEVAARADAAQVAVALAEGSRIVHFMGHGGRFIWRTGPADWTRQRDLFNLDDIDRLPESERLPLVLSMSCYTAPFDHPTADSIGEKLLRVPGRGAIAVFAASWRNTPHLHLSTVVLDRLYDGPTIGEALQRAKRRSYNRDLVWQYNLLGDPALRLVPLEPRSEDRVQERPAPGPAVAPSIPPTSG